MGLCMSKSSARSSTRSEKSEKCRWDKHGNVFFPVRRHSQPVDDNDAAAPRAFMKRNSFATTNPVYADFESPSQSKISHFSSFSKLLKGSKAATLQCSRSRRSAYRDLLAVKGFCTGQQSVEEGKEPSFNECNHVKRSATLIKLVEAENNANVTLSRSSSAKEASEYSFTRSEAALSRCSSQKEGKRDFIGEPAPTKARPSPEHLAAIACLKPRMQRPALDGNAPENGHLSKCQSKQAAQEIGFKVEKPLAKDAAAAAIANKTVEAVVKSHAAERKDAALKQSLAKDALPVNSSFLTKGLGLPSYQPLVFRAGSPDKCRGRFSSTHSSLSSEDLAASAAAVGAHARRRRSPKKMSPSRRSPSKRSPSKRVGGNGNSLISSAARPQSRTTENLHPNYSIDDLKSQVPRSTKSSTAKNSIEQANRSVLKELPRNDMKLHEQVGRQPSTTKVSHAAAGLPPKARERQPGPVTKSVASSQNCSSSRSEKFSVYSDEIHLDIESSSSSKAITTEDELTNSDSKENSALLMKGEPRSGSKRLRSPKKLITPGEQKVTKEYLNFNLSVPASTVLEVKSKRSIDGRNVSCERIPSEDKHIDSETNEANRDREADQHQRSEDGVSPPSEPDLLELLERTPKKLKKMALKLALMIELEHSQEDDDSVCELDIPTSDQTKQVKTNEKVGNSSDVDLELKLGMPNEKSKAKHGDGLRLDFSLALDSPGRAGSNSVPMTPRHSVSSICNGLSVEARIGSSKGLSSSDFSFHILKNPDKLFGSIPRFHITRKEQTEQTGEANVASSTFHVETGGNKAAVEVTYEDQTSASCTKVEDSANTASGSNCSEVASEPISQVQRCSSFDFKQDDPTPANGNDFLYDGEDSILTTPTKEHVQRAWEKRHLDLNKDARLDDEESPGFQFKVRSAMKSSPETPIMPTAAPVAKKHEETDALSLSADEIAEIWGAFEAGQESC